jgi:hypothetical protein
MTTATLQFHTPPRNRGRSVTVSYAATADGQVIQRRYDPERRVPSYRIAPATPDDDGDYWNGAPTPAGPWTVMGAAARQSYGLA